MIKSEFNKQIIVEVHQKIATRGLSEIRLTISRGGCDL